MAPTYLPPGFFFKSYERPYYWFEAIDMIRKFILVAGLAIFEPGSTTQLMLAQLVCLCFLGAVLNLAPYKKDAVDFTNQASHRVDGFERQFRSSPDVWFSPLTFIAACVPRRCRHQATNFQIMTSLLIAMALKTNLPQPGTFEAVFFGT